MEERLVRTRILLCSLTVLLLRGSSAHAQLELIMIEKPFVARSLSGVVLDPSGAPIAEVLVEQCNTSSAPNQIRNERGELVGTVPSDCAREPGHILASTKTNANGFFSLPGAEKGKAYYLHLSSPGFDPMQITVKLRFYSWGRLRIKLHIAT